MSSYNLENLLAEKEKFADKTILLHACCAVCAIYVSEVLKKAFGKAVLYFYNPNVHPQEEYQKRLEAIKKVAEINGLDFLEGEYETEKWHDAVRGLEGEPEGGRRCDVCFALRLEEVAKKAAESRCDYFTSTLTVNPHKNQKLINEIGRTAGEKYGVNFLAADFKKRDGFKKSMLLAKEAEIYRQNYCGCLYSQHKLS